MRRVFVGSFLLGAEEKAAINEVLDSGRISESKKTWEFEKAFARFIETRYSIAVSSGTSALIAGMTALKHHDRIRLKEGSAVVTTPVTYIATSNAIIQSGLKPVYVDVDPQTFGITAESVKQFLESADDASAYSLVLPVHLMGYACDMDGINKAAKRYGLQVFEDSAQAHGTLYKGKRTGSLSLLGAFSFYIAHNIQAGEMGAVTTNDPEISRLVKKIKANGRMCDCLVCTRDLGKCPRLGKGEDDLDPRFTHDMIGYNFKTMEFQAALGALQLKKVEWIIRKRQENVRYLNERMEKFSDVLQLPVFSESVSYLAYPIVIKKPERISRKKLRYELEKLGVENRPLFGCIPTQQPAFRHLKERYEGKLPNAEYLGANGFYVGVHQYLTREDLDYIASMFEKIMKAV